MRPVVLGIGGLAVGTFGAAALWFDGPAARPLAGALAAAFLVASLVLPQRRSRDGVVWAALLWGVVWVWWSGIDPRNDRDWLPDVARPASATFDGERVTVHNVRNFEYRSDGDYTERWETRTYDLDEVRGLDIFLSRWGSPYIAHTIMSWDFGDGPPLAVSIETRKERGEAYSAVRGFFRQFELYYVVGDERDLVGLRASVRGEQVSLYRLAAPPARARELLRAYLDEINRLADAPAWYNAFAHNCTTTIRLHVLQIGLPQPWDWRILVNGHLDELLYERGSINDTMPFPALRAASDVTERAKAAENAPDFSRRIREVLPARPQPRATR
jgi:hypothetical protein